MEATSKDINKNESPKVYQTWDDGYLVRAMTAQDARIVQDWYCGMGMTSRFDLDTCLKVYPPGGGFYIGEKDGEVVASAIRIPWGDVFYGSYYYVVQEHRRAGYGTRLRDQVAREFVGDNILCVDAVMGKVAETNKKYGYVGAFNTGRFHGKAKSGVAAEYSGKIVKAQDIPLEDVIAYDDKHFVRPNVPVRHAFVKEMLLTGSSYVALDGSGKMVGYGCSRPCIQKEENIVGPLYADNVEIAEALLQRLCSDVEGEGITINIWYPNQGSVDMVKKFGWDNVFDVQRMHVNGDPKEFKDTVFALTSIDVCGF